MSVYSGLYPLILSRMLFNVVKDAFITIVITSLSQRDAVAAGSRLRSELVKQKIGWIWSASEASVLMWAALSSQTLLEDAAAQ